MNLQTTKPRARWLAGGDPATNQMWEISHPDAGVLMWSGLPHDGAVELMRSWILPRMVKGGSK